MLGRLGVPYKHISSEIGSHSICALIPTVCTPLVKTITIHACTILYPHLYNIEKLFEEYPIIIITCNAL